MAWTRRNFLKTIAGAAGSAAVPGGGIPFTPGPLPAMGDPVLFWYDYPNWIVSIEGAMRQAYDLHERFRNGTSGYGALPPDRAADVFLRDHSALLDKARGAFRSGMKDIRADAIVPFIEEDAAGRQMVSHLPHGRLSALYGPEDVWKSMGRLQSDAENTAYWNRMRSQSLAKRNHAKLPSGVPVSEQPSLPPGRPSPLSRTLGGEGWMQSGPAMNVSEQASLGKMSGAARLFNSGGMRRGVVRPGVAGAMAAVLPAAIMAIMALRQAYGLEPSGVPE